MESFSLFFNKQLLFEEGAINNYLVDIIQKFDCKNIALLTSRSVVKLEPFTRFLESISKFVEVSRWVVSDEPQVSVLDKIIADAKEAKVELVIAIGGGSVLDSGKALSFMLMEEGSLLDYLEGVGTKSPSGAKVPFIAIPTTAGTGSEATKNGVVSGILDGKPFKKSFRHENFISDIAILDPELCMGLSTHNTAACGMDAITQLLEAFVSTSGNPITHALAESGLAKAGDALDLSFSYGDDIVARGEMLYAAYLSGVCLGNADLGAVHGLAGPLGALCGISHGVACAILLPVVTEQVIRKLIATATLGSPSFKYLVSYARAGYLLNNELDHNFDIAEGCRKLMKRLKEWQELFALGSLSSYGLTNDKIKEVARLASNRKSPVLFDIEEFEEILRNC